MSVPLNEQAGGACRKPLKNAIQLAKSPLKHYLKTVYKMILKSKFFYCQTYELDFSSDVVEGGGVVVEGGGGGYTMYEGFPRL